MDALSVGAYAWFGGAPSIPEAELLTQEEIEAELWEAAAQVQAQADAALQNMETTGALLDQVEALLQGAENMPAWEEAELLQELQHLGNTFWESWGVHDFLMNALGK